MKIVSPAFPPEGDIPSRYTCDGEDVSPPLAWSDLPAGTRSLALVLDDPDAPDPEAPQRVWVHWVVYDIPAYAIGLDEETLPVGARVGSNDWRHVRYNGPCPTIGRHRYVFTLYALDAMLGDRGPLSKIDLLQVIEGHVIEHAHVGGHYAKQAVRGAKRRRTG